MNKEWSAFSRWFAEDKDIVLNWMDHVNQFRADAHSKSISDEDFAYLSAIRIDLGHEGVRPTYPATQALPGSSSSASHAQSESAVPHCRVQPLVPSTPYVLVLQEDQLAGNSAGTSSGGDPITIAISRRSTSSISAGSPGYSSPSTNTWIDASGLQ
jgi:hypothetical protein